MREGLQKLAEAGRVLLRSAVMVWILVLRAIGSDFVRGATRQAMCNQARACATRHGNCNQTVQLQCKCNQAGHVPPARPCATSQGRCHRAGQVQPDMDCATRQGMCNQACQLQPSSAFLATRQCNCNQAVQQQPSRAGATKQCNCHNARHGQPASAWATRQGMVPPGSAGATRQCISNNANAMCQNTRCVAKISSNYQNR